MSLEYNIQITGTCNGNVGSVKITPTSGNPPYSFVYQNLGSDLEVLTSSRTGLLSGGYSVVISDSSFPTNLFQTVNFNISNGISVTLSDISPTTCGLNNGFVSVTAETSSQINTFNLYDENNNLISSNNVYENNYYYNTLSAGVYNIVVDDNGGCTGQSGSFLISSGNPLNFGLYVVNDGLCNGTRETSISGVTAVTTTEEIHTGKIYVTGLTGNAPFTYLWSNGQTGTTITGLTPDLYSCTITSADGCILTKGALVETTAPLGLGSWVLTQPTCFNSDGVAVLTITGGTGPYYYLASNGEIIISYSQSITYTGLPAGDFSVEVTDASLCKETFPITLTTPAGFLVVAVNVENSSCSSTDGKIIINLRGGSPPYTYTLVKPSSDTEIATTSSSIQIFSNLSAGDYTLFISDSGPCDYQQEITVLTSNKFDFITNVNNSVCGLPESSVQITISGSPTYPIDYVLSNGYSYLTTFSDQVTFNYLPEGTYELQITDFDGCRITRAFTTTNGSPVEFSLYPTGCGLGSDGVITAFISQGTPPFTLNWSDNVNGQTGTTVTGLTAGTYSLTVIDNNGCNLTNFVDVVCTQYISSYKKYAVTNNSFNYQLGSQRTLQKLLNEGFNDSVTANTGCVLFNVVYGVEVIVEDYDQIVAGTITGTPFSYYDYCQNYISGNTIPVSPSVCFNQYLPFSGIQNSMVECYSFTNNFYTGYTRTDVPTNLTYYNACQQVLESIPGITSVTTDFNTGTTNIQTEQCLVGKTITINLTMNYNLGCQS